MKFDSLRHFLGNEDVFDSAMCEVIAGFALIPRLIKAYMPVTPQPQPRIVVLGASAVTKFLLKPFHIAMLAHRFQGDALGSSLHFIDGVTIATCYTACEVFEWLPHAYSMKERSALVMAV